MAGFDLQLLPKRPAMLLYVSDNATTCYPSTHGYSTTRPARYTLCALAVMLAGVLQWHTYSYLQSCFQLFARLYKTVDRFTLALHIQRAAPTLVHPHVIQNNVTGNPPHLGVERHWTHRASAHSRVGPKSGGTHNRLGPHMLLRLLIFLTRSTPTLSVSADARVDIGAITMSGIALAVKPNGQRKASEPPNSHTQASSCIKRSFRRAYGRACRAGGAYYKGRWRRQDWFRGSNLRPQLLPNIRPQRQAGPHWRTLCWNAGGLTTSVFQELETYVRDHSIDIVLIQESKWTHDSTWTNKDYHYVHSPGSGKHDRYGGLLIMISTRLAKAEDIQFYAPHPGRLLHVRIPHGSTHVDILNWCQYAINQQHGTPDRRQKLLMQIQKTIAHLPRRNVLLLGGDFNCPCEPHGTVCGTAVVPHNPLYYPDVQDHQHVWRSLHLTALNTWSRPQHGQLATFIFGEANDQSYSQIDFVMIRSHHITDQARTSQVVADFPVAAWRGGTKHCPVLALVPVPRVLWKPQQHQTKPAQIDRDSLLRDLRQQEPSQALQALRTEVDAHMHQPLDTFNQVLLQAGEKLSTSAQALTQSEALANCARDMWRLFRGMRRHRFTMQGVITAWRQWAQFTQAHRIHKARSKERSKQRRINLLDQGQQAANRGDAHGLWATVRQLAPKAPRRKLQLRRNGHMISVEAEMDWILEAYGQRYSVQDEDIQVHFAFAPHTGIHIEATDLEWFLFRLNPRKATPKDTAPALLVKACAHSLSRSTAQQLNTIWGQGGHYVPTRWSDADVALLVKAHGRSASPLDLRPIGVQDALGKAVMSTVILRAKQARHTLRSQFPPFSPQCTSPYLSVVYTQLRQMLSLYRMLRRFECSTEASAHRRPCAFCNLCRSDCCSKES